MRLKQIKLAGFKSFVDLTKVPFPHQMTAIVGPNGCGKSNIIDAVRWVLGESSAKNLRGDAMTDVIFNGASERKAVGQASVELIFDNTLGQERLNAEFVNSAAKLADRAEIAVRRQVSRDGQNQYFLNGTKCRRRDITDIFLGTGLGPRSYAIIEQGTISRLIESKPQELRVFIEEAAGISQYKERRRETELKIKHTVENMQRLDDIRFEVEQQLEKLHIQAEAAKQFKDLKINERRLKSELIALQWRTHQDALNELTDAINDEKNQINRRVEQFNCYEDQLNGFKLDFSAKQTQLSKLQLLHTEHSKNCIVAQENLKHARVQEQKTAQDQLRLTQQHNTVKGEYAELLEQTKHIEEKIELQVVKSCSQEKALSQSRTNLQNVQSRLNDTQARWNQINLLHREHHQTQGHLSDDIKRLTLEKERLDKQIKISREQLQSFELLAISPTDLDEQLGQLTNQINNTTQELLVNSEETSRLEKELASGNPQLKQLEKQQSYLEHSVKQIHQLLDNKHDWQKDIEQALTKANLQHLPLYKIIEVNSAWRVAFTTLIGHLMHAPVVDKTPGFSALSQYCLIEQSNLSQEIKAGTIAEQVKSEFGLLPWLNHIYLANDIDTARVTLKHCQSHESVICLDGTWLGHGFIIKGCLVDDDTKDGAILSRQAELQKLQLELEQINSEVEQQQSNNESITQALVVATAQQNLNKEKLSQLSLEHKHIVSQQQSQAQQFEWQQQQSGLIQASNQELVDRSKQVELELNKVITAFDKLQFDHKQQQEHEELNQQQTQLQQQINQYHNDIEHQQTSLRQTGLLIEQLRMQHIQLMQSQQHAKANLEVTVKQLEQLPDAGSFELATLSKQVEDEQQSLNILSADISALITACETINSQSRDLEQRQKALTAEIEAKKAQINQGQINLQNFQVRAETCAEQLKELRLVPQDIIENLPDHTTEKTVQRALNNTAKSISTLGAINLAAIDEYQQHISRKNHLDLQHEDLTQAVSTLESAIAKIDHESRYKFKSTFEQVNNDLKTLFPKVFGGGSAYLELTSHDMLEAGVTIMARPPGKKNSTIHLLSGGEKALTALSLVFAIFRLNPAPFCMLDEVDAPLDDTNVGRFCNLVREMSQTVQFIYISHNKIAMEMASHLTGVTMFEPGVSRMVSVDIDEAIAMAEVS